MSADVRASAGSDGRDGSDTPRDDDWSDALADEVRRFIAAAVAGGRDVKLVLALLHALTELVEDTGSDLIRPFMSLDHRQHRTLTTHR